MVDPMISLFIIVGIGLLLFWFLWPRRGLLDRLRESRSRSRRILQEDTLKHIYNTRMAARSISLEGLAGVLGISRDQVVVVLEDLQRLGLIRYDDAEFRLSPRGRESALHILRAHRLWERYLAERSGYEETEWHPRAEIEEHRLSREDMETLSAELGFPTHDPHGDPIPNAQGEMVLQKGMPLTSAEVDTPLRIIHMEDEPEAVFAQLVAEGLHIGQVVRLISKDPQRIRLWAGGDEHLLAPIIADNLSVLPYVEEEVDLQKGLRLSDLQPGDAAEVVAISPACRGPERRRLLDLGLLPGTRVSAELLSPSGDPKAYRIRGALFALRENQAKWIQVKQEEDMG